MTVTGPGVVEIFCNIHQKMTAKVLVVPNMLYTKVHADGTFRIENVPPGDAAAGGLEPGRQGGVAEGGRQRPDRRGLLQRSSTRTRGAHANKFGQAYGSYRD